MERALYKCGYEDCGSDCTFTRLVGELVFPNPPTKCVYSEKYMNLSSVPWVLMNVKELSHAEEVKHNKEVKKMWEKHAS